MATVNKGETGPKKVKITLMRDNKNYQGDVFVGVNGETWQIQRGVEVEVPEYVAEVLKNSMKQDNLAFGLMQDLQKGSDW